MKKILSCLLVLTCLVGCSSNSKSGDMAEASESTSFYTTDSAYDYETTGDYNVLDESTGENVDASITSKIIYTASIDFETKDFNKTLESLDEKIKSYNGYVLSRELYKYGEDEEYTSAYYSIRIPVSNYNNFLNDREEIANVTSLSENADDITDTYIDLSARLENLKAEEETIRSLLDKATDMSDILEIEERLSEVRGDIESYQSQINYYDKVTEYATITISISQVRTYTANKSFIEKVGDLFKESFSNFGQALYAIFSLLIYAIPYLIIALIIFLIVRKIRENKKDKDNINKKQGE